MIGDLHTVDIMCHQMSDFKVRCTKFAFRWGSSPDPAPHTPYLYLRGLLLLRGGRGRKEQSKKMEKGKGGRTGGEGFGPPKVLAWRPLWQTAVWARIPGYLMTRLEPGPHKPISTVRYVT